MGKKLFTEFPPVSTREWEEMIHQDLCGADYEKKLIWQTHEGIPLRPYYREEDIKDIDYIDSPPGEFPFVRGTKTASNDWLVRQDILVEDIDEANLKAIDALMKGAGSIGFVLDSGIKYTHLDIGRLLKDICLSSAEINYCCGRFSMKVLEAVDRVNSDRGGSLSKMHGTLEYDPVGELFTRGNYSTGEQGSFGLVTDMIKFSQKLPNFRVINVNATLFHDSGGSAVQELAFAMSSAAEYLERMTRSGIPAGEVAQKIKFTFSSGSNYFMEIAKFRAARYLWSRILEAWEVRPEIAGRMYIHAETSRWNKTIYDPYVNVLRSTTESMSAILGGADALTVDPFDKHFRRPSPFSERIARNTQLVIKEEAYFDKVADPAAGSYYIESLTTSLIDESFRLFLETVSQGGVTEAFKKGFIQEKIEKTAIRRNMFLAHRRDILLGTNQYPDPSERVMKNIDPAVASVDPVLPDNPLARPLRPYRGAQIYEDIRLRTERHKGGPPKVFLLQFGNISACKARAAFSSGFFACGGFEIMNHMVFNSLEQGVTSALESNADVVVLCSSDEEYLAVTPSLTGELANRSILVVAGSPGEGAGQLKEAGVKHFIHIRSDIPETLKQFQKELGIQ
jgi:methylmalonyl-CoA mutase